MGHERARVPLQNVEGSLQKARLVDVILMCDDEVRGLGGVQCGVPVAAHATPHVVVDHAHAAVRERPGDAQRIVRRQIVDADEGKVSIGLCQQRFERTPEEGRTVEDRNGHREALDQRLRSRSTLRKKLERTIWHPRVSETTAGTIRRNVRDGSSEPKLRSPHTPTA